MFCEFDPTHRTETGNARCLVCGGPTIAGDPPENYVSAHHVAAGAIDAGPAALVAAEATQQDATPPAVKKAAKAAKKATRSRKSAKADATHPTTLAGALAPAKPKPSEGDKS